LFIILDRGIL